MRDPREASLEVSCRELRAHTATNQCFCPIDWLYVDGDTIKMELVLTTARGDTVRITRYLVRSALPAPAPAPVAPG